MKRILTHANESVQTGEHCLSSQLVHHTSPGQGEVQEHLLPAARDTKALQYPATFSLLPASSSSNHQKAL